MQKINSKNLYGFYSEIKELKNQGIRVTFRSDYNDNIESAVEKINEKDACVFWYFGSYGLKQGSVDFYKPHLTKILHNKAIPYLVDLSAWRAFKKPGEKLTVCTSKAKKIHCEVIKVLKCSDFFTSLAKIEVKTKVFYLLEDIVERRNLAYPSKDFDDVGFTLGDVFNRNCPVLKSLYELDCAKTYSIIQYIEVLFLIDEILKNDPGINSIRFILPNDEAKYYLSTLQEDISQFLSAKGGYGLEILNVEINCFRYGNEIQHRPYNAPGEFVKKLSLEDTIDRDLLCQLKQQNNLTIK